MLLQMEYDAEKESFQQAQQARGVKRLLARGDAWFPLRVSRSYYNSLNQLCVEVFRHPTEEDEELMDHNFEFGRPVQFFKSLLNTQLSTLNITGTVSFVDGDRMVIAVPDGTPVVDLQFPSQGAGPGENWQLGVMLFFDETSYRLMFEALERTMRAKGRLGYLRDLFYTATPSSSPSAKGKSGGGMKAETFTFPDMGFDYLNKTQEHAVNEVLRAKDVAIVHGPPGTGKTTTLVEAIYETLRREPQVLVCAQSNMAVDWISEKLVDRGLNVLRIGNPSRVDDKMLSFTYERRFEAHPDYPQLWAIRKAIRDLRSQRKHSDNWHQKMDRLKSRATELEIRINQELFSQAHVVACTLVGSANRLLDGQKFGTLFIDEAAQALEAACWIAIRRAGRVILAGDHCQLPPTVKCYEAMRQGLGHTLMERLVELHPEAVTLLRIQYRMNEDIMRFPARWFYHNRLVAHQSVKWRGLLDLDCAIEWVNPVQDGDGEQFVGSSFGRVNPAEAEQTLDVLERYFTRIGKGRVLSERIDVGIISPYRAQVQLLRRLIRQRPFFKPFRQLLTVNTVDGFQGQERDVIVVSMVRSNEQGQIGFLRDLRRMNVAMTRARMKLIIMGNAETLCRHRFYRELYSYVAGLARPDAIAADGTAATGSAGAADTAQAPEA